MDKKIFSALVILCACISSASAQFGLQLSYLGISGQYAYTYKSSASIELTYRTGDTSSRIRGNFSVGFYQLKPTQDTFPTYGINSNSELVPGKYSIKNYSVIPIGFGIEYHPFGGRLTPYAGIDGYLYIINNTFFNYISGGTEQNGRQTDWATGISPKLCLSYVLNQNWLVSAGICLNVGVTGSTYTQDCAKTFINISYYPAKQKDKKKQS